MGATLAILAVESVAGVNAFAAWSSRGRVFDDTALVPARSVAIVPGAATHDGRPLGSLTGRLETALTLYQSQRVKAILVSGNDTPSAPEVSVMRRWLEERGVPPTDIWSDERGSRTRETMLNAAALFNVSDAVVCTQAPYVDRALLLARHAGIDAVGVGLPTSVSHSTRWMGIEALKTTIAFLESYLRGGVPEIRRATAAKTAVAVR